MSILNLLMNYDNICSYIYKNIRQFTLECDSPSSKSSLLFNIRLSANSPTSTFLLSTPSSPPCLVSMSYLFSLKHPQIYHLQGKKKHDVARLAQVPAQHLISFPLSCKHLGEGDLTAHSLHNTILLPRLSLNHVVITKPAWLAEHHHLSIQPAVQSTGFPAQQEPIQIVNTFISALKLNVQTL